ncbi:hypothetical protein [Enterococcus faecalis]|uniref:hypothetical protein n=1 Tax=Enterococcus faecalis TaxID=1351 RepID=UPI001CEFF6A5|nr:hypothetical protein [Enterococcus faecalis]UNT41818.1 hypothetical protein MPM64_15480 [Enterococcus faecalis]
MSVFNNKNMVSGYVNHVAVYDGGSFKTMFVRLAVFNYMKEDKAQYEVINAQISCSVDQQGRLTTTSSHPKALLNKMLFDKLDKNLVEGMKVTLHGSLRGSDQVFLSGRWRNFKDLSSAEKEEYKSLPKGQLITRTNSFIYIEEVNMPSKEVFLKRKEELLTENQMNEVKVTEPSQADQMETDDNDPVDNEGVVVETVEAEIIEPQEGTKISRRNTVSYVRFEDMIYPEATMVEEDYPF